MQAKNSHSVGQPRPCQFKQSQFTGLKTPTQLIFREYLQLIKNYWLVPKYMRKKNATMKVKFFASQQQLNFIHVFSIKVKALKTLLDVFFEFDNGNIARISASKYVY